MQAHVFCFVSFCFVLWKHGIGNLYDKDSPTTTKSYKPDLRVFLAYCPARRKRSTWEQEKISTMSNLMICWENCWGEKTKAPFLHCVLEFVRHGIIQLSHSYAWDITFIPLGNIISTSASPRWILVTSWDKCDMPCIIVA